MSASNRWFGNAPTGRTAMIHPRDIALAAETVILDSGRWGATYELTGPHAVTMPEVAALLTRRLGRQIDYVPVSEADMRAAMVQRGVPDYYVEIAIIIDQSTEAGQQERVRPELEELTGTAARTADQLVADHVSAFAGTPRADA